MGTQRLQATGSRIDADSEGISWLPPSAIARACLQNYRAEIERQLTKRASDAELEQMGISRTLGDKLDDEHIELYTWRWVRPQLYIEDYASLLGLKCVAAGPARDVYDLNDGLRYLFLAGDGRAMGKTAGRIETLRWLGAQAQARSIGLALKVKASPRRRRSPSL